MSTERWKDGRFASIVAKNIDNLLMEGKQITIESPGHTFSSKCKPSMECEGPGVLCLSGLRVIQIED